MPIDFRRFTLPIQVMSKHDGDGFTRDRGGRHYIPTKKLVNANAIRDLSRQYAPPEPWKGPIRLDVHCVRNFPVRLPKKWKGAARTALDGLPHFEGKPDIDNQLKQVGDAIEGLFYEDDHQVCCGTRSKSWGVEGCVHIFVAELRPDEHRALVREWWNV